MSEEPGQRAGVEPLDRLPRGERQLHLAGFMGSGKSTVGRLLARRLVWNFLDLDALVARHAGMPIARIFERQGEEAFREMERYAVRQVVQKPRAVVALGGGTLIDERNRALCAANAGIVWLDCPLDVVRERLGREDRERPLWRADELQRLLDERLPGYRSVSRRVDATGSPEEVADAVLEALGIT